MEQKRTRSSEPVMIPGNVLVPCPLKRFGNRRAAVCCPECDHFRGVSDKRGGEDVPDGEAWRRAALTIICACPITRRCTVIED